MFAILGISVLLLVIMIAARIVMLRSRPPQKKLKEVVNVKYAFLLNKKVS